MDSSSLLMECRFTNKYSRTGYELNVPYIEIKLHPAKINGWNLNITQNRKQHDLNQKFICLGVQNVNVSGC